MSTNNKISNLINTQVPFFVRNDHQTFIKFIEKYYKFLEQNEGLLNIKENLISYRDIDYVTRNSSNIVGGSYSTDKFTLANTSAVVNNANTGNIGFTYMITLMGINAVSTLTGTDKNLYLFLSTGSTSYANYAYSYADINRDGITTSADAVQWRNYILNGTTGNTSQDVFASTVANTMLAFNGSNPGYFNPYLFMATTGNTVTVASAASSATSFEQQAQDKFYDTFLRSFPKDMVLDKAVMLKHAKEFYLTRGSERSIKFLLKIMFGEENVSFYYPKNDVIKASDGKWYIQKTLRLTNQKVNNVATSDLGVFAKFIGRTITGVTSGATATGEDYNRFYNKGTLVDELTISNVRGTFRNGEQILADISEGSTAYEQTLAADIFSGILNSVRILNAGTGYAVGQHPVITNDTGTGGDMIISSVTGGNISSITVSLGGAGYRANDILLFSGATSTIPANAYISIVTKDSSVHPNSYNICYSTINLEASTPINNTKYSNLVSAITNPANHWIQNSLSFFVYSNTGPAAAVTIVNPGSSYLSVPTVSVVANNRVQELGILGRMTINNGGTGYSVNDKINFIGGTGSGASANVTAVNATGSITAVRFVPVTGQITGGSGYSSFGLPTANVTSAGGSGANISVTGILAEGATFITTNSSIGAIQAISIISRGSGYSNNTTINLSTLGNGQAQASVDIVEGVYTYPGRYLNDDGMPSSYNFLQDQDYYQNFSYVIRSTKALDTYRKTIKDLAHPAGMKMFGDIIVSSSMIAANVAILTDSIRANTKTKTYVKTANSINMSYTSHGRTAGNTVYLEFISSTSGNSTVNGIYNIASVLTNSFIVYEPRSGVSNVTILNPGNGYGNNTNGFVTFSNEGVGAANARYTTNATGAITSITITDYGKYYTNRPTANINKSNTASASLFVYLNHYANNSTGSANVTINYA